MCFADIGRRLWNSNAVPVKSTVKSCTPTTTPAHRQDNRRVHQQQGTFRKEINNEPALVQQRQPIHFNDNEDLRKNCRTPTRPDTNKRSSGLGWWIAENMAKSEIFK
ncbi:MAG: hypothetical protein GY820_25420 [Gammaproteobacteria bacterium]|nr:hypothetical protein [Gammaproteobacteria bacterium]